MSIDMHAHWIPKGFADMFRQRSKTPRIYRGEDGREILDSGFTANPVPPGFDNPETRLADMDKHNISRGVLSLTPFMGIEVLPLEDSVPLCRTFNDSVSEMCATYPDRFSAFAALPLRDLNVALQEFERAMALPGIVGAVLPSEGFLTEKRAALFRPLLDAADRRCAVLMIHYGAMPGFNEKRWETTDNAHARVGSLDMQASLSQNMVTLCMTEFMKPYQNLTIMSHNLGGNIPFEIERMDHRSIIDRPKDELPSKRIRAGRFLVDCNSLGARAIELAVETYGAEKIVMGSDGTGFGMQWTADAVAKARISAGERQAILDGNAEAAIKRVVPRMAAAAE
jgi:predicted TIM-barrel fold metal-dependent hydrolase